MSELVATLVAVIGVVRLFQFVTSIIGGSAAGGDD